MTPVTRAPERPAPTRRAVASRGAEVLAEVEAERAALAAMLHDDVMQSLLAARFAADLSGVPEVRDAVREAIAEAGAAMWRLKPRTADGHLVRALDDLADRYAGEVVLSVRAEGVPDRIDPAAATVAYRVVQAAVAACEGTTIDIRVGLNAGVLTVSVCDDGPSYEAAAHATASELIRWLARAGALGGRARIGDGPAGGTTLWLEIPDASAKEPA